jgi:hypothetical protein
VPRERCGDLCCHRVGRGWRCCSSLEYRSNGRVGTRAGGRRRSRGPRSRLSEGLETSRFIVCCACSDSPSWPSGSITKERDSEAVQLLAHARNGSVAARPRRTRFGTAPARAPRADGAASRVQEAAYSASSWPITLGCARPSANTTPPIPRATMSPRSTFIVADAAPVDGVRKRRREGALRARRCTGETFVTADPGAAWIPIIAESHASREGRRPGE